MSLAALAWFACTAPAFAESVPLFRVFLNDGTAIVSYGEYARVGDRLVFSMPIGAVDASAAGDPSLHVVNLPVSSVNWTATEKYAESARHTHYMANSAESDYAALAGHVASTLNAIVLAKDPKARLKMAMDARRRLATWPKDHYEYRADDVREMLGLLDEAISGLRVAAGETSFTIDLIATAPAAREPRDHMALLRAPTAAEIDPALDRCGQGHRHCGRSRLDSSRRHRGDRQSAKRPACRAWRRRRADGRSVRSPKRRG